MRDSPYGLKPLGCFNVSRELQSSVFLNPSRWLIEQNLPGRIEVSSIRVEITSRCILPDETNIPTHHRFLKKGNRKKIETIPLAPGFLFSENWRASALVAKNEPCFVNRTWSFDRVHCQHEFIPFRTAKPFYLLRNKSDDGGVAFRSLAERRTTFAVWAIKAWLL